MTREQQKVNSVTTKRVEDAMVESKVIKTKVMEGSNEQLTKKIDVKKAWERSEKERLAALRRSLNETDENDDNIFISDHMYLPFHQTRVSTAKIKGKKHLSLPPDLSEKITSIIRQLHRDDDECLVRPKINVESDFCCEEHKNELKKTQDRMFELYKMQLKARLKVQTFKIDFDKTGYVGREQLYVILKHEMLNSGHMIDDKKCNELLDGCVINLEEQQRLSDWASNLHRTSPLNKIPLHLYSSSRFVDTVADIITDLEYHKVMNSSPIE